MRLSRSFVPTLKEVPGDAEVVSHQLLVRGGFIRQLAAGIYTFLPLGLRCLDKVATIIREEMDAAGAIQIHMPMVQPGKLWKETGRWEYYGKELLRLKDRKDSDYCLGPTHEEVITDLVRGEIRSYRQMPLNLYQIQTKFRDEVRPRFGLMRCREFVMKDAYSFDVDDAGADKSYWAMYEAYTKAFTRLGLGFKAVEADSGAIGGNFSHEFMVLAATGEDTIAACPACDYAANLERARFHADPAPAAPACPPLERVATPGAHTVEEVTAFLKVPATRIVKTLLYEVDGQLVAAMVRGDRELNEVKLKNVLDASDVALATPDKVRAASGAEVGFAGPVGLPAAVRLVADLELQGGADWVVGANATDAHLVHVDLTRDAQVSHFADLRSVVAGDACPKCRQPMGLTRGIEVGHVFKLGLKYSAPMQATYLDADGKAQPIVMGCYGIGVSRIIAAAIEQNHDDKGIRFSPAIAPYEVALLELPGKDGKAADTCNQLYWDLTGLGVEVLWDDRDERPGVKFNDADLLGLPIQLVVGGKGIERGIVEAKDRRTGEKTELPLADFASAFAAFRRQVWAGWGLEPEL